MNYRLLTDEILVKLIKASDEKALKEAYQRYYKFVFNAVYHRIRSKEATKEIVQNLFVWIWEKREQAQIQNLEAYLHTSAKNRVINYIESQVVEKKHFELISRQPSGTPEAADSIVLLQELNIAIEKVIHQLPEKTQTVFRLSRFENLSAREIASYMGLSEKAVEYHLTKSLKLMRIHLKDFFLLLVAIGIYLA